MKRRQDVIFFFVSIICLLFVTFFQLFLLPTYHFLFGVVMELSFYCVLCRSMVTISKLRIPAVAVGRMQCFLIVAEGRTHE